MSDARHKSAARRVRLLDVAKRAACSTATVSRALNTPDIVAPEVRRQIAAAMRELGYVPDNAARALRSRRTRLMGIVIPTLDHAIYARLVESMEARLADHGYSLMVASHNYDLAREVAQARVLIGRGMDGLAFVGALHDPGLKELIERAGIPFVNTYVATGEDPAVGFDNCLATEAITEYLLTLGHRVFGVVSAIVAGNDRAADRVAGVRLALRRHGLDLPPDAVFERPYSIPSGREGLRHLVARRPRPTAIVCGNDVMAMGALAECRALGLRVPDDLSIVGIDDIEFAAHLDPPLTTLAVPAAEMGRRAADVLVEGAAGRPLPRRSPVEPRLIVRGTTGPAPAG